MAGHRNNGGGACECRNEHQMAATHLRGHLCLTAHTTRQRWSPAPVQPSDEEETQTEAGSLLPQNPFVDRQQHRRKDSLGRNPSWMSLTES